MKITKFHKQIFREAAESLLTGYNPFCCAAIATACADHAQLREECEKIFFAFYFIDSGISHDGELMWRLFDGGEQISTPELNLEARVFALLTICQFNHTP